MGRAILYGKMPYNETIRSNHPRPFYRKAIDGQYAQSPYVQYNSLNWALFVRFCDGHRMAIMPVILLVEKGGLQRWSIDRFQILQTTVPPLRVILRPFVS